MRYAKPLICLLLVTIILMLLSLGIGTSRLDWYMLGHADMITWHIRLPRVILAALVGATLASCGLVLQAVLQNPLADPFVTGVSGGAALGAVVALLWQANYVWPWAFVGATASMALLFGVIPMLGGKTAVHLLLAGVTFNAFTSAVITVIQCLAQASHSQALLFWLMGGIGSQTPQTLVFLALFCGVGLLALFFLSPQLNMLLLGDDCAHALGVRVVALRLGCLLVVGMLVGAVVSWVGMIGFVGLIVPHIIKWLYGGDHKFLLPACMLGGASYLILADLLCRLCFYLYGTQIPVGALTSATGAPFFLWLLIKQERVV